ncbi:MAG: glutathione peroxidase [Chitinophagales bacterium]|nr:glutathione peroxidase [Chitinophagales bacterium]
MERLMGGTAKLDLYKGKVLLIVNVASKCGLTPQYKDLEEIYKKYQDSGLMNLGFPANNFLRQEPGDNKDIAEFCQINYGVSFDMFSKISVKGDDMHPLYQFLTQKKYNQHSDNEVSWNFQKYLIDKEGNLVQVISPKTKVTDSSVINQIEALLGK